MFIGVPAITDWWPFGEESVDVCAERRLYRTVWTALYAERFHLAIKKKVSSENLEIINQERNSFDRK